MTAEEARVLDEGTSQHLADSGALSDHPAMSVPQRGRGGGDDVSQPNFLYIGPDKAGSSWLHEVLLRHEQVFMPEAKDLYFFDRYWERGLPWYLDHFAPAGPQHAVVGEVCQDYLFHAEAAERIQQALGQPRLMVTLRDPAERAFSSWLYALKQGADDWGATFSEGLRTRPELLDHGRYASHLARYLERFGRDRLHVSVFDDLVEDPQRFVDDVLAFLEIAPHDAAGRPGRGPPAGRAAPGPCCWLGLRGGRRTSCASGTAAAART